MLSEIMEEVCQPFYFAPLGVEKGWASRKAMKVPARFFSGIGIGEMI